MQRIVPVVKNPKQMLVYVLLATSVFDVVDMVGYVLRFFAWLASALP